MTYKNPSRKRSPRLSTSVRLGVVAVAACFIVAPARSNPVNPTVVNGAASFSQAGNVLTVTNSNGAIINWDKFSIKAGETTHFAQTAASSSVLNRVLNDPTAIYGTLSSNGRVWLVNPAGIMVGPGGRIDTAAFVASTLAVRNEDFLAGRHLFVNDGNARDILNQGEIKTPAGGSVYLIGGNVGNEGIITTPKGDTILAAGATVSLIDSATPGVKVDITGAAGNSTNLGEITAEAGRIGIAGVIVRNGGQLNASSVVSEGGRIFLRASRDAYVDGNGRIVTTGAKGGSVEILAKRVAVMDGAGIDASGAHGGGTILVGGDFQGKNPDIENANITYFGPKATLKADATEVGAGGTVIVWADDTTRAYGSISARGGFGGDGGLVETSGKRYLDVAGARIDTRAPNGKTGNWLLDPSDITIVHSTGSLLALGGATFAPGGATSTTSDFDINNQLATTNVSIQTSGGTGGLGDITLDPGVVIHNGTNNPSFSLQADRNISIYGSSVMGSSGYGLGIHLLAANGNIYIKDSVLDTYGGAMSIVGINVTLTGATGYGAIASTAGCAASGAVSCQPYSGPFVSGGMQTVTASNVLKLEAPAAGGKGVGLVSGGGQNITADSIEVLGGVTGQNNGAHIVNYSTANQLVQAHSILIKAGGSAATDFNDGASISSYGSQLITITGSGGALTLYGGAGGAAAAAYGGIAGANYGGDCLTYGGDINYCYTSSNRAEIAHRSPAGYGQTISFAGGSGTISLYGGSDGAGNSAEINNDSDSYGASPGAQVIGSASYGANIYIQGGGSGGKSVYGSNGKFYDEPNGAGIEGDSDMTVYAGTITLVGGGGTGAVTGAFIGGGADVGGGTMNIYATGDVSLTGGSSAVVAAVNNNSKFYDFASPAAIGSDKNITIKLEVGGNLSLTGGSGTGSGAFVGAFDGVATIAAQASGNVTVTANAGAAGIGSLHGYGGSLAIYGGQDITFGDNTGITNGQGFAPIAATHITLLAKRNIGLGLSSNDAYGGNVQVIAGWDGNTTNPGVYGGPLTGGNLTMTGAAIQTRNSANLDVRAYGDLVMTSVNSAAANLWLQNSSGGNAMNVYAGHDISLTAAYGSNALISMDGGGTQTITAGGALTLGGAAGSFSPGYGGAAVINAGNAGLNTTLQHVSAHQISLLAGGSDASNNKGSSARIQAYGPQTIDIIGTGGGIALTGNGGASGSDNSAIIRQLSGTASQAITFYGSGASLVVTAGSGAGTAGTPNSACASDPNGCGSQAMSSNLAGIENDGSGAQTLSFNSAGGSIALYGGSAGVRNTAFIYSPYGAQQISGAPAITLTGGASGGSGFQAADGNHYLSNHAVIYSQYGAQTISAASLSLNGAAAGASAGTYGGASIEGLAQAITVYGATTLTAGGTSRARAQIVSHGNQSLVSTSLALQGGSGAHGNKAVVIGNGTQTIELTGSGNVLTLSGGSGASSYDNYAQIEQLAAGGSQSIALTGTGGGNIVITGGSGAGTGGAAPSGCAAAVSGDPCYGAAIAHNNAGVYNAGSGGQTVSFGYGGALALYGGSVGNRNNAFIQSLYGGQAISGTAAITLVGGTSGGAWVPNPYGGSYLGNGVGIRSDDFAAPQSIYGSSITLAGTGAGAAATTVAGASIRALGSGGQTVFATGAVTLTGGSATYGGVGFISAGAQTFTAQSLAAYGGAGGHDNAAVLSAYGNQVLTLTGAGNVLTLTGGGGTNPDGYNNYAEVRQLNASSAQTINLAGSGANVILRGGTGDGLLGQMDSDCVAGLGAVAACQASHNKAAIDNAGSGGQTLSFAYGGGSLQIYGGSAGYGNSASVENSNNTSSVGVQQILGAPDILLQGGTSGGRVVLPSAGAKPYFSANEAGIFSDNTQTINAGTLTLTGGSGAATVSPAVISAPTQIITASGAIVLQGGSGSAASAAYGGSYAPAAPWSQLATGAVIGGNDKSKGNVTIKGGSISAIAGSGSSGAVMIGSLEYGADVQLGAYGDIVLRADAGPLNIGSAAPTAPTSYGGVTVVVAAGKDLLIDALGSGQVGIGATNILAANTASISLSAGRHLAINGTGSGPVAIGAATATTPVTIVAGALINGVLAVSNSGYGGNLTVGANTTVSAYGANASLVGTHGLSYGGDITLASGSAVHGGSYIDVIAGGNAILAGTLQTNALTTGGIRAESGAVAVGTANGYGGNLSVSGNLAAYGDSAVNLELTSFGGTANAGTLAQTAGNLYGGGFTLTAYGAMSLAGNVATGPLGSGLIRAGYQGATGWRNVPVALTASGAISGDLLTIGSSGDVSLAGSVTSGASVLNVTAGDFAAGTGGNITLGGNTLSGYGGVMLTANHGSGANGDITQAASGTIAGLGTTSSVDIHAGGNLALGSVQAATSIFATSGSASGGTANGYGGSVDLLGNMSAGSLTVKAHGGSSYGGDLTLAAGKTLTSTVAAQTLTVRGDGNVGLAGNIVAPTGSVSVTSGYSGAANKFAAINAIDTGAGTVNVAATGAVLDNNGVGTTNITANSVFLSSTYGGTSGGLAISTDTQNASSINATVYSTATNGGIRIGNVGTVAPASIGISDQTSNATSTVKFTHTGSDLNLTGSSSFSAYGDIAVLAAANASGYGGNLSHAGATYSTQYGSMLLGADKNLTVASALTSSAGDLGLAAGQTLDINGTVAIQNGSGLLLAPTINLNGSVTAAAAGADLAIIASTLNLPGTLHAADSIAIIAGNLVSGSTTSYGGSISTGTGNVSAIVAADIRLNNGAAMNAGNSVFLTLNGASSTLYINEAAGLSASHIHALNPNTIHVDMPNRATAGGIVIDGTTTTTSVYGGSGLFVGPSMTPAAAGAGLQVTLAPSAATTAPAQVVNDLISATNDISSTTTPTESSEPPPPPPPAPTTTSASTGSNAPPPLPVGQSLGGTEGTFGGDTIPTPSPVLEPAPSAALTTAPQADTGTGSGIASDSQSGPGSVTNGTSAQATSSDKPPSSETKKEEVAKTEKKDEGAKTASAAKDEKKDEGGKDEKKDEKKDDKDKKDKKKSDEAKDGKKDDKPAQKKVAQCS